MKRVITTSLIFFFAISLSYAGNPDRQGEAGAGELLFNPWARSAGLHTLGTASIRGVESMRLNIAGLGRINKTELLIANTRLFTGTEMQLNAVGFAQKIGENSAFGISLTSVDFGEIPVTTTLQPEGTGGTFSPNFFHLGLGYSYTYANKISVGLLVRGVSESLANVSAFGIALDAGVQYVSGEKENFKLGISLRNVGSPMRYSGEGLSFEVDNPGTNGEYKITFDSRSEDFELPSVLNIGLSYDYYFGDDQIMIRGLANFTSNSFSQDQLGVGGELYFKDFVALRAAYKKDIGSVNEGERNVYSGFAAGMSLNLPLSKDSDRKVGFDYAYRTTDPFRGTHNFTVRLTL